MLYSHNLWSWSCDVILSVHTSLSGGSCNALCAGSLAAAARELRPIEIVSLYENQREVLERELAGNKAEVGKRLQQAHHPWHHHHDDASVQRLTIVGVRPEAGPACLL